MESSYQQRLEESHNKILQTENVHLEAYHDMEERFARFEQTRQKELQTQDELEKQNETLERQLDDLKVSERPPTDELNVLFKATLNK